MSDVLLLHYTYIGNTFVCRSHMASNRYWTKIQVTFEPFCSMEVPEDTNLKMISFCVIDVVNRNMIPFIKHVLYPNPSLFSVISHPFLIPPYIYTYAQYNCK